MAYFNPEKFPERIAKTEEIEALPTEMAQEDEDFIMSPKVDFCFKELMQNEKVRKGIIAALLGKSPEAIESTTLLPTILRQEYPDDKYGILDVLVKMKDGTKIDFEMQVLPFIFWTKRSLFYWSKMFAGQIKKGDSYDALKRCIHVSILNFAHFPNDEECYHKIGLYDFNTGKVYSDLMELHILELSKLPPEALNESGLIHWMRFLNGKNRKEFEEMAEKDEYIGEAYELLKNLSADEKKRIEYEYREKALKDYNTQILSYEQRGREEGLKEGEKIGKAIGKQEARQELLIEFFQNGGTKEDAKKLLGATDEELNQLIGEN